MLTDKETLHLALRELRVLALSGATEDGICGEVTRTAVWKQIHPSRIGRMGNLLHALMSAWPAGTHSGAYPVPGNFWRSREKAREAFNSQLPRWTGRYGTRRFALLDWLIEETA